MGNPGRQRGFWRNALLKEALKREIKEEHGIDIEIVELLDVCDHLIPEEHQHWVSPTYICKIIKGEPRIIEPEKCDAIGWFTREEATKLPLSIVTEYDLTQLAKKYPAGFPKQK